MDRAPTERTNTCRTSPLVGAVGGNIARAATFMAFEGFGALFVEVPRFFCSCGSCFPETVWRYCSPANSSGTGPWAHLRAGRVWWSVVCPPVSAWMASPIFVGDATAGYLCPCPCPQGLRPMRLCHPLWLLCRPWGPVGLSPTLLDHRVLLLQPLSSIQDAV